MKAKKSANVALSQHISISYSLKTMTIKPLKILRGSIKSHCATIPENVKVGDRFTLIVEC